MTTNPPISPTVEKWGGDQEANKCDFCGAVKPVQRYYLNVKNKHFDDNKGGCYSTFIYYCQDCGIEETQSVQEAKAEREVEVIEALKPAVEAFFTNYFPEEDGGYLTVKFFRTLSDLLNTKGKSR